MSDIILNINFDESKKKNGLIIETYEGIIPSFKSKKYSGQLRNININAMKIFDNISNEDIQVIREILNNKFNIQINKYQYMIAPINISNIRYLLDKGCLFYKDKKKGMFQIENIFFNKSPLKNNYSIDGVQFKAEKTSIYFYLENDNLKTNITEIIPKVYIDLNKKNFNLELKFDYGRSIIDFFSKNRYVELNETYRDFNFEDKIKNDIEESGWKITRKEGFIFNDKDINKGISKLIERGIKVYTNSEKKIIAADFSNIRVNYNLDWFNIDGEVSIEDEKVEISKLIDFRKKREKWIEYNGKIVLLPYILSSKSIKKDSVTNKLYLDKKNISTAIDLAYNFNKDIVYNFDELINYNDIEINIDINIKKILREYQIIGVKWLLALRKNGFGACLADDMGLGKTLQIIAFLSDETLKHSKNLIIVPKTLLLNWYKEMNKFSPNTYTYIYHGKDRDIDKIKEAKVIITTYQTIVNDILLLKKFFFDNIVIDEAQYIKNPKSKAYKAINALNGKMKIILTGTPIENNLLEFWSLMKLINPSLTEPKTDIFKNQINLIDRIKKITSPFLLRRMKKDVLKDLPEKQEQVLLINMENEQQMLYNKMLKSIQYEILRKNTRFEIKSNSIVLNGLLYLQEICCHPQLLPIEYNEGVKESAKLETLMNLLKNLYFNEHKIIVFSRFTRMLSIIEKRLLLEHMNYYYLDGSTKNRMEIVEEFEKSPNGIFLISLKAGGTGLNLTSADTAIIYDPWWNPASEKQAEDRIYRIGQNKKVMIYKLIVEGSIEEKIQKLQEEKLKLSSEILDGHEVPTNMTIEIMKKLIF